MIDAVFKLSQKLTLLLLMTSLITPQISYGNCCCQTEAISCDCSVAKMASPCCCQSGSSEDFSKQCLQKKCDCQKKFHDQVPGTISVRREFQQELRLMHSLVLIQPELSGWTSSFQKIQVIHAKQDQLGAARYLLFCMLLH